MIYYKGSLGSGKIKNGSLAQLGEHLPYKQRVIGSSPITSTNKQCGQNNMREWLSGRASPCQGECRGFESRFPLQTIGVRTVFVGAIAKW